jgi:hypothetical protein
MGMWKIVLWGFWCIPFIWNVIRKMGDIDFVVERSQNPSWLESMWKSIVNCVTGDTPLYVHAVTFVIIGLLVFPKHTIYKIKDWYNPKKKKDDIIDQLNKFVRNGNDLIIQISNAHSSQFHSKCPPMKNAKPSLAEQKTTEWSLAIYNYLKDNEPSWAEYYHNLSMPNDSSINYSKNIVVPQEKNRAILVAM